MPYRITEEGNNITLTSEGTSYTHVFQDGGAGLFSLMYDIENVRGDKRVDIVVDATSMDTLFAAWLKDLLERNTINQIVFSEFSVATIQKVHDTQYLLTGAAYGEDVDPAKHILKKHVKDVKVSTATCEGADKNYICQSVIVTA